MLNSFPRPDLPAPEKFKKDVNGVYQYAKDCLDFAINYHITYRNGQIRKMNELYRKYNGTHISRFANYFKKTYGKKNIASLVDYRLGRTKIEKLVGEFTERPLNTTVFTVNKKAQMAKLDKYYRMLGLYNMRETVNELRDKHGEDAVGSGMPIPSEDAVKSYWTSANSKTKNEITMQYLVNDFVRMNKDFIYSLSSCYRDGVITAETHGRVCLDKNNVPRFQEIDPRDRIFKENDRDHFAHTSPYQGHKRRMFLTQIIEEFKLTPKEVDLLMAEGANEDIYYFDSYERVTNEASNGGDRAYWVYYLQWKSFDPIYTKIVPSKNPELNNEPTYIDIYPERFVKEQDKIMKDVAAGEYSVETSFKEVIWEGVRLSRSLYRNCGPKKNIIGSYNSPFGTKFEYVTYLSNTINGIRVSIKELMCDVEEQYNIVRYMINRELAKMKGMSLSYDRAFLPKGETTNTVLHKIINDGIIDYNSGEDGNVSGETKDPKDAIKAIDLGVSSSLQALIMLGQNLEATAEMITGISNQRIGDIKASETATNANSAINNSKTMTEPFNIGFDTFVTEVINLVMEQSKIAVLINPEWGERIVGKEGVEFIKVSKDITTDDFGNYLQDYRKEKQVRDRAMQLAEQAINSGAMKIEDLMEADLEETVSGAIEVLRKGSATIIQAAEQQRADEIKLEQQKMANAVNMAKEQREDQQAHEIQKIVVQGQVDSGLIMQEAANKNIIEQNKTKTKK